MYTASVLPGHQRPRLLGQPVSESIFLCTPNAQSQLASVYRKQEREKQRNYEQGIREIELSAFTPLMFSTSGGMAKCASVTYKRLTSLLSTKRDQPYSLVIAWLRLSPEFFTPEVCHHLPSWSTSRSSSGCAVHNGPLDVKDKFLTNIAVSIT